MHLLSTTTVCDANVNLKGGKEGSRLAGDLGMRKAIMATKNIN